MEDPSPQAAIQKQEQRAAQLAKQREREQQRRTKEQQKAMQARARAVLFYGVKKSHTTDPVSAIGVQNRGYSFTGSCS